jgi:hypothetical protein
MKVKLKVGDMVVFAGKMAPDYIGEKKWEHQVGILIKEVRVQIGRPYFSAGQVMFGGEIGGDLDNTEPGWRILDKHGRQVRRKTTRLRRIDVLPEHIEEMVEAQTILSKLIENWKEQNFYNVL